jgi:hypothetical protein
MSQYITKTGIEIPRYLTEGGFQHALGLQIGAGEVQKAIEFYKTPQPERAPPSLPSVDAHGNTHMDQDN